MRPLTLRPCLAMLLATAGVLAAAPAASADTATCTFDSVAGTLDPDTPVFPATGGGEYSFSGAAQCRYHDRTPPIPAVPVYLTSATISSAGEYQGNPCVVGDFFSETTTVTFFNPSATDTASMRQHLHFVGGSGVMTMEEVNGDTWSHGGGAVELSPTDCAAVGLSSFALSGSFALTSGA